MAVIPTFTPTVAGTAPVMGNAASGDTAPVGAGYWLIAKNTTGGTVTITFATPGNLETGDAYPDKVYTLAATTGEQWIPLLPAYKDPTDGMAHLTWQTTGAGITRVVLRTG